MAEFLKYATSLDGLTVFCLGVLVPFLRPGWFGVKFEDEKSPGDRAFESSTYKTNDFNDAGRT